MLYLKQILSPFVSPEKETTFLRLQTNEEIYNFFIYQMGKERDYIIHEIEKSLNVTYFDVYKENYNMDIINLFSISEMKKFNFIPIRKEGNSLFVTCNEVPSQNLKESLKIICSKKGFNHILIQYMFTLDFELDKTIKEYESKKEKIEKEKEKEKNIDKNSTENIVLLSKEIINKGLEFGATDIHIEPLDKGLKVRYRVDSILSISDFYDLNKDEVNALVSRMKIISEMDIAEKRKPQDGRIPYWEFSAEVYNFRVSSVSTIEGEKLVFRIFKNEDHTPSFKELGFDDINVNMIQKMIKAPNGMIIIAGATGAGKTTTMHTALNSLDGERINISSIEDPVEKKIKNVNQIPIDPKIDITFANVLRSLLRQDPDVIAVGEIRDKETAELSVKASLTGHLVISTIHANDAHSGIERLFNLGIEPFQLGASLLGIVSQRLVRKLCPYCKTQTNLEAYERNLLQKWIEKGMGRFDYLSDAIPKQIYSESEKGCSKCNGVGYKGRTVISEVLLVSDQVQEYIMKAKNSREIYKLSLEMDFKPLEINGIEKILHGETSIKELMRVLFHT